MLSCPNIEAELCVWITKIFAYLTQRLIEQAFKQGLIRVYKE